MKQRIQSVSWRTKYKKPPEIVIKGKKENRKKKKKKEEGLMEIWDNMKHNNIHIIGIPEGEEEQWIENLFE